MLLLFILLILIRSPNPNEEDFQDLTSQMEDLQNDWIDGRSYALKDYQSLSKINILVTGFSGVGKSTLINYILKSLYLDAGIGKPITKEIINVTKEGVPIEFYDTPGIEIDPKQQKKLYNNIYKFIKKRHNTKDTNNYVHCIWYCVNAESKRFQDGEIDFIKKISQDKNIGNIPIVIVLTQCIDTKVANKMIEVIKEENLNVSAIIPVLSKRKEIEVFGQTVIFQPFGFDKLIEKTKELVPDILQKTLSILTKHSLFYKRIISHSIVAVGSVLATAMAGDLIPYTNVALVVPSEFLMCYSISFVYEAKIPINFIMSYIKWQTGYLEITNETFSESIKQTKATLSEINNHDDNYDELCKNVGKNLGRLLAFVTCKKYSKSFSNFADKIKEMMIDGIKLAYNEIVQLVAWFSSIKGGPITAISTGTFSIALGKSFMGFVEDVYLKKDCDFTRITAEDIRNHIHSAYKNY